MNDYKLLLTLASKMLLMAQDDFSNHRSNDLDKNIYNLIPDSMLEEMRQWNSKGRDPWPEKASLVGDSSLMHFLSFKLEEIAIEIDRDNKINKIIN